MRAFQLLLFILNAVTMRAQEFCSIDTNPLLFRRSVGNFFPNVLTGNGFIMNFNVTAPGEDNLLEIDIGALSLSFTFCEGDGEDCGMGVLVSSEQFEAAPRAREDQELEVEIIFHGENELVEIFIGDELVAESQQTVGDVSNLTVTPTSNLGIVNFDVTTPLLDPATSVFKAINTFAFADGSVFEAFVISVFDGCGRGLKGLLSGIQATIANDDVSLPLIITDNGDGEYPINVVAVNSGVFEVNMEVCTEDVCNTGRFVNIFRLGEPTLAPTPNSAKSINNLTGLVVLFFAMVATMLI